MRARVVRIGNSWGIRIPKALIQQTGLGEEIKIAARENYLVNPDPTIGSEMKKTRPCVMFAP